MKYFIDFEATQYTEEIISIGCIREDGERFKRLVKPNKLSKVTAFITELTGITREMLENEKSSDEVFEDFFDWLTVDSTPVQFYCYGDHDLHFIKTNLDNRTNSFKAQAALSVIAFNLTDYSIAVKKHFGLIKPIALKKVMDYFYPNDEYTLHDALSDAEMLYKVYIGVENEQNVDGVPFPDYVGMPIFQCEEDFKNFNIIRRDDKNNVKVYRTLQEACDDVYKMIARISNGECAKSRVSGRIRSAINNKKKYFGYTWNAQVKKNNKKRKKKKKKVEN